MNEEIKELIAAKYDGSQLLDLLEVETIELVELLEGRIDSNPELFDELFETLGYSDED